MSEKEAKRFKLRCHVCGVSAVVRIYSDEAGLDRFVRQHIHDEAGPVRGFDIVDLGAILSTGEEPK